MKRTIVIETTHKLPHDVVYDGVRMWLAKNHAMIGLPAEAVGSLSIEFAVNNKTSEVEVVVSRIHEVDR